MMPFEPLALDKDVFGENTVIVLRTPGHTPGHQSLLVKLPQAVNMVLSGDAVHSASGICCVRGWMPCWRIVFL